MHTMCYILLLCLLSVLKYLYNIYNNNLITSERIKSAEIYENAI